VPDYPRRRLPQQHLPLTVPVFQILLSLSDRDLHGYAIIQDIRRRYYRITALGLDVARLETGRLERALKMARQKKLTPKKA
jgi:DNA-binding PadR family transcriptional regulator